MMSESAIIDQSIAQGRKAAKSGKEPYELWPGEVNRMPPFPFPNIGDYRPTGWELVDTLLCDKSRFGSPSEPALTVAQLLERLRPGFGYAIIEEGQFQVVVGEFEHVKKEG